MNHLSTEELLLLAEGEAAAEGEVHLGAHLESCAQCRAALGELQGTLTAATTALRAQVADESPAVDRAAWERLSGAMAPAPHLELSELLLYCENELGPERAAHLESCSSCHDRFLRAQALLAEVSHELRGQSENEPAARRAAALAALEARMRPAAKVIAFPLRWTPAYAAAAALALALGGGFLYNAVQSVTPAAPQIAAVQQAPQPPAAQQDVAPRPAVAQPEASPADVPAIEAPAARPVTIAASAPRPARFTLELPAAPEDSRTVLTASGDAPRVIARAAEPQMAADWTWSAPAARRIETEELTAAVLDQAPAPLATQRSFSVGDRVVGGLVRTALLDHYRDSARRSFQSPEPAALEGELARFVTGLYRHQSELLQQAYELNQVVAAGELGDQDRRALRKRIELAAQHERAIYDGLSEALPRRYWAAGGSAENEPAADPAAQAQALLDDTLALEETLTTMLNRSSATFNVESDLSSGRLLERIQSHLKSLRASLRTL